MKSSRHRALVGLATFALAVSFADAFATTAESGDPQEYLQRDYDLQVTIQNEIRINGNLRSGSVTNTGQADDYLRALATECKKYPTDFFSKAGVSEIVLCGTLEMGRAPIAGTYFERQKKLYVKFHWCRFGARCRETFHSFHHELGHALQAAAWGDGHAAWREWSALNPPAFHYGSGGSRELMANPDKHWGTWSTNQPGFINAYSTTAPWEDRSELMAALMNDGDRMALRGYYRRDPVLQKKIELMSGLLSKLCGPHQANYFWEQAIISLQTQPEVAMQSNSPASPKADLQFQKRVR